MIGFDLFQVAQEIAEMRRRENALMTHLAAEAGRDLDNSREMMMSGAKRVLGHFNERDMRVGRLRVEARSQRTLSLVLVIHCEGSTDPDPDPVTLINIDPDTWFDDSTGAYVKGWRVSHKRTERVLTEQQLGSVVARVVAEHL